MLKNTKEKFENYWEKIKFKSVNGWIVTFKVVKIIGWLVSLLGLIWPFIPFTNDNKHSSWTLAFSLVGFVITGFGDMVNDLYDLWFKPKKDKSLAESIINFQEKETKKE